MEGKPKDPVMKAVCFHCGVVIVKGDPGAKVSHGLHRECALELAKWHRLEEQQIG